MLRGHCLSLAAVVLLASSLEAIIASTRAGASRGLEGLSGRGQRTVSRQRHRGGQIDLAPLLGRRRGGRAGSGSSTVGSRPVQNT